MSEHLSCKECTGFAPNSANYRESHPEYQASSSKHNSRFPKACHQVQTSVPPFMPSRNVSKTARGTLQTVQKKTLSLGRRPGTAEVSPALCSPSPHELLLGLHNSWPLSNLKAPDKTATPHASFLRFLFPVTSYHLTYTASSFYCLFSRMRRDLPFRQQFFGYLMIITIVPETRRDPSPQQQLNKCLLNKC